LLINAKHIGVLTLLEYFTAVSSIFPSSKKTYLKRFSRDCRHDSKKLHLLLAAIAHLECLEVTTQQQSYFESFYNECKRQSNQQDLLEQTVNGRLFEVIGMTES
jgi:hypothetical protein